MKLLQKNIQLLPVDEKTTLFFHTETLQIYPFENDNEILIFLQELKTKGKDKTQGLYGEKYQQYYDFIVENIEKEKNPIIQMDSNLAPTFTTINMPISGHCNLNCPYCFAQTDGGFHFNDYTEEDAKKIIDFVVSKENSRDVGFYICFFGGEPFLKLNMIKFIIQYCKEKYPKRSFRFTATTNGTIVNEEIIQLLKENNMSILISIDGPDNEFNLRRYKNGEKSIGQVIENIKTLKNEGIDIELRATIVNTNPYIMEAFQFFESLQVPFSVMFAQTSENKTHSLAEYNKTIIANIKKQFTTLEDYYLDKIKKQEAILNQVLWHFCSDIRYRKKRNVSCAAGYNFFCVTAKGDIFSCAHFMNNKTYSIGTISEGVDLEKRKQYVPMPVEQIPECQDCWIKYLCVGGCTAQKITSGKRNNQSLGENECELQRIVWEFYLKLYYYIMTYAPSYLIKEEDKE